MTRKELENAVLAAIAAMPWWDLPDELPEEIPHTVPDDELLAILDELTARA